MTIGELQVRFSANTSDLEGDVQRGTRILDQYGNTVTRVARSTGRLVRPSQQAARVTRRTAQATEQAAQATRRAGRAMRRASRRTGNFTNILFSAGQTAQDARFGFRGVANNLVFMAEEFGNLQRRAGGARAVLKGVGGALLGVGGVIFAFQLLVSFGPEIVGFFRDLVSGANDAEEAMDRAYEKITEITTGIEKTEFRGPEIDIGLEASEIRLENLRPELQGVRGEVQRLQAELAALEGGGISISNPILRAQMLRRAEQLGAEATERRIAAIKEELPARKQYAGQLEYEIKRLEDLQAELQEVAKQRDREAEAAKRNRQLGSSTTEMLREQAEAQQDLTSAKERAAKIRKELSGTQEENRLRQFLGDLNLITRKEEDLEAVKDAFVEVAGALGKDSDAARELLALVERLRREVALLKGEATDVRGGAAPPVPVAEGQRSELAEVEINYDAKLVFDWRAIDVGRIKERLQETLGSAITSAPDQFGREFTSALFSAFRGPDEQVVASLEERKQGLKDNLRQLQLSLSQGEIAHATYAARVRAIHAELAETNRQLAYETAGVFEKVFRSIGNLVKNVIRQVMAEITAAIARAAILAAISAATGGSGSFLGFLSGRQDIGAVFARSAGGNVRAGSLRAPSATRAFAGRQALRSMQAARVDVRIAGEFVQRGEEMVATIDTVQRGNARRGFASSSSAGGRA